MYIYVLKTYLLCLKVFACIPVKYTSFNPISSQRKAFILKPMYASCYTESIVLRRSGGVERVSPPGRGCVEYGGRY